MVWLCGLRSVATALAVVLLLDLSAWPHNGTGHGVIRTGVRSAPRDPMKNVSAAIPTAPKTCFPPSFRVGARREECLHAPDGAGAPLWRCDGRTASALPAPRRPLRLPRCDRSSINVLIRFPGVLPPQNRIHRNHPNRPSHPSRRSSGRRPLRPKPVSRTAPRRASQRPRRCRTRIRG